MKYSFLFLVLVGFQSAFGQSSPSVQNHLFQFSLNLPEDWYMIDKGRNIRIEGPFPEKMGINYVQDTQSSLDERFEYFIKILRQGDNFEELGTGREDIQGQAYRWIKYNIANAGGRYREILYLTVRRNKLYSITLTSTQNRFDEHGKVLFKILKSLKMK